MEADAFDEFRLMTWRMNPKIIISYSNEKSSLRIWPNNFLGKQRREENNKRRRIQTSTLLMFFCILKVLKCLSRCCLGQKCAKTPKPQHQSRPEHIIVLIIT